MSNFHEMPFVRALLLALVVLFVVGAGMPGGALARVEMRNGHEGDPQDGMDVVSGGSGEFSVEGKSSHLNNYLLLQNAVIKEVIFELIILGDGTTIPVFIFCNDLRIQGFSSHALVDSNWRAK